MHANLYNKHTNKVIDVKVGFSWTEMFFGFWTALFRGDGKWCFLLILAELCLGSFTWGGGAFLVTFIFAFFYNKRYVRDLIAKGYEPYDKTSYRILLSRGYVTNYQNFSTSFN